MGAETEVITHVVTVADATVSQFGFGVPLVAAPHSLWADIVRAIEDPDILLLPPYSLSPNNSLYVTLHRIKQQTPSPPVIKIGKLGASYTHSVKLTPVTPASGTGATTTIYTLTVDGVAISHTAAAAATIASVITALLPLVNVIPDVTASGTTDLTIVGDTPNQVHTYSGLSPTWLTVIDQTPAYAGLAADLAAMRGIDGDWYALNVLLPGAANILAAAGWAESQRALYLADSLDSGIAKDAFSSATDVAKSLNTAGYHRSSLWYHPATEQLSAAVIGALLPKLPGPITFANKGLVGVNRQNLSAQDRINIKSKKANCYVDMKGLGFTLWGWAASGRFLDVTVAIDWFDVGIENRIVLLLRNNDVVPYTAKGIELVRAQILAQVLQGITLGIIDGDQNYSVTAPALDSIDPNLKAQRILPDIRYAYTLSGAIHSVRVIGVVQV